MRRSRAANIASAGLTLPPIFSHAKLFMCFVSVISKNIANQKHLLLNRMDIFKQLQVNKSIGIIMTKHFNVVCFLQFAP